MSVAIITGSSGLIGSETAKFFHEKGLQVIGIDNDLRSFFFGTEASTAWNTKRLQQTLKNFRHLPIDIRDEYEISKLFADLGRDISLVVHTAAQPSHDWAATDPGTDFTVNANGTMVLLQATRKYCPDATFIFTSTNKVYGDTPNGLPLVELPKRWEIEQSHCYYDHGIDETMSIDQSRHSLFGVSKVAADLMTQEYGKLYGLKTGTFRGGCLTGPAHSGTELHGFLSYLVKCVVTGKPYTIYGYKGKQVRDNIHSYDLVNAFWHFYQNPQAGAVYNMGGSRHSNCSMLEGIEIVEELSGRKLTYRLQDSSRSGDHIWWISDTRKFQTDYPQWSYQYDLKLILSEIVEATQDRVGTTRRVALQTNDNKRMKLSVVIPARNESTCIGKTVRVLSAHLAAEQINHEVLVIDDDSTDDTKSVVCQISEENQCVQYINNSGPHGFGFAVQRGLERYTGDAVAVYMADGSDRPEDLVRYFEEMQTKDLDCVFGSRFTRGAKVVDYPVFKLWLNRMANTFIRLLFGLRYNDVTNAFKLYRRHVIDGLKPFLSHHFNLTVELPLKAIVRGYTYSVIPNDWINRKSGVSKLRVQEMGSRYLFIVLYCFIEKWLSKQDYHRSTSQNTDVARVDVRALSQQVGLPR